jgi:leader peptidase (prepilin peptidase) / N-methyltransferase
MQEVLEALRILFESTPAAWIATVFVLGLFIGSFLNVVIHRLPIMMERAWKAELDALAHPQSAQDGAPAQAPPTPRYNLIVPRSACPKCGSMITASQNIPVLSWLLLKGKCAKCAAPISARYPIIEAATAVLSAIVAWHFGFTWYCGAALLLTWALISLSVIDYDTQYLPDDITLPLMWLGLLISLAPLVPAIGLPVDPRSSIIGAAAGYVSLWSVYHVFKLVTGKEGMGYGDFKLLAVFGAWLGWQKLLLIILLSAFAGAVVGMALIAFRGRDRSIPIPFGPYLATAGWIALLWGDQLVTSYLRMSGMQR